MKLKLVAMLSLVAIGLAVDGCTSSRSADIPAAIPSCNSSFSEADVQPAVESLLKAMGEEPPFFPPEEVEVHIWHEDGFFHFIASRRDLLAVEPTIIWFDDCGRVKTFPHCCYVNHCPALCSPPTSP